jgi:hypothetical protein
VPVPPRKSSIIQIAYAMAPITKKNITKKKKFSKVYREAMRTVLRL